MSAINTDIKIFNRYLYWIKSIFDLSFCLNNTANHSYYCYLRTFSVETEKSFLRFLCSNTSLYIIRIKIWICKTRFGLVSYFKLNIY